MALFFFPRGGSAYVARHLARLLPAAGWDVTLVAAVNDPAGRARIGDAGWHASRAATPSKRWWPA